MSHLRKTNKFNNIIRVSLFLMSLSGPIFGQTTEPELSYTWKECLDIAIKNNPELASALSKVQSSEYGKKIQRSNYLPSVSASVGKTNSSIESSGIKSNSDQYSASLNASYNLFNGLRDYNLLSQAEASIETSKAQYVSTSADILYELKSAYENYRYAKNYTLLMEKILQRRKDNLRLVQLRFEGGLENKGSELLSQGYLAQAEYDLLEAQQSLMTTRSALAKVLGLDANAQFNISGELQTIEPPKEQPDFEALARTTPTYVEALAQEKYYKKSINVARSGFSPSLDVSGSVGQTGTKLLGNDTQSQSIGVTLSIPLFDGGSDYYGIKQASANYASQRSIRINTQREVSVSLREKFVAYLLAVKLLKTNTILQNAAEVRAEIARGKYNNGLLSFEDWVIIENDLITKQKSYLTSKRSRVLSEASWYQVLGKGIAQ